MADDEVKKILDDTESLLKRVVHKVCDILIRSSRKKMEKICSDPDIIVHYRNRKKDSVHEGEK